MYCHRVTTEETDSRVGQRIAAARVAAGIRLKALGEFVSPQAVEEAVRSCGRAGKPWWACLSASIVVYFMLAMCLHFSDGYGELLRRLTDGLRPAVHAVLAGGGYFHRPQSSRTTGLRAVESPVRAGAWPPDHTAVARSFRLRPVPADARAGRHRPCGRAHAGQYQGVRTAAWWWQPQARVLSPGQTRTADRLRHPRHSPRPLRSPPGQRSRAGQAAGHSSDPVLWAARADGPGLPRTRLLRPSAA